MKKSIKVPVSKGTLGPDVLDIRSLYKETGLFTYDPGFTSTASCDSNITFIDGDKGELLYRGYPIEQLAEKSTFFRSCLSFTVANYHKSHNMMTFVAGLQTHNVT